MAPKPQREWRKTRKAADYRTFLSAYLEESSRSLSDLARASGFGRGFPGDVISGKRRLTAKSFAAFETALELPVSGRKLFRYLVAAEETDLFPSLKSVDLNPTIRELRAKPWSRVKRYAQGDSDNAQMLFANPDVFSVYAAIGTAESGASLATIRERTRLSEGEVTNALSDLKKAGLLSEKDGVFAPNDTHVFLKSKGKDEAFIRLFQARCSQASRRIDDSVKSEEEMFFTSSFCVNEQRLPELKAALRQTLLGFVDQSIDSEGGRIIHLLTAMFL